MGLTLCEILGLFEISQILVICDYGHQMFSTCEVMMPFFESLNDSKGLSVINVVVLLSWGKGG